MRLLATIGGTVAVLGVILDAFETILLPRRVTRRVRPADLFLLSTWSTFARVSRRIKDPERRDTVLAYYGPSLNIAGIMTWALVVILGFALIHWGTGSHLSRMGRGTTFGDDLYFSGTTFFTLGLGDIAPLAGPERAATVAEAGLGLGILAIVIAYIPVLYQTFSRREIFVNRLESIAGSPPTPGGILLRYEKLKPERFTSLLEVWQDWTAELMESIQSYPVVAFYRSQHSDQSWLLALTTLLDACVLVVTDPSPVFEECRDAANLAYSLALHAVGDIAKALSRHVAGEVSVRPEGVHRDHLRTWLEVRSADVGDIAGIEAKIDILRLRYEHLVAGLSDRLAVSVPAFCPLCTPEEHQHSH